MKYHLPLFLEEYERLGIRQQPDYDKNYLYSIIANSAALSGSTLTEDETRLLFEKDNAVKARIRAGGQKQRVVRKGGQKQKGGQKTPS